MNSVRMVDPATYVDSLWHRYASPQAAARVAPAARAASSSSAVLDGSRDVHLEHGETRSSRRLYPLGGSNARVEVGTQTDVKPVRGGNTATI